MKYFQFLIRLDVPYHTTGNEAIIIFKSDSSGEKSGFALDWNADGGKCGNQILQSESGKVTSPGYPQNYAPLAHCIWTINTQKNTHISLHFTDFAFEPDTDGECFDYLDIWDSRSTQDEWYRRIDRYCGKKLPPDVKTTKVCISKYNLKIGIKFSAIFDA